MSGHGPTEMYRGSITRKERMDARGRESFLSQTVNGENRSGAVDMEKAVGHLKNKVLA